MLWYCAYTWHPGTTREQVRERILQQDAAGTNRSESIKGWYDMVGGGAGFLLVETADPQEVNDFLMPYMDLMAWDVRAVNALEYTSAIERFKHASTASSR